MLEVRVRQHPVRRARKEIARRTDTHRRETQQRSTTTGMGLLKQALKTRHGHIDVLLRARTVDTERILESKWEAKNKEKSKRTRSPTGHARLAMITS